MIIVIINQEAWICGCKERDGNNKVRIAIDLTSLADNFSGIERYAMNITKELIELDKTKKHTYILLFKRNIHQEFNGYKKKRNVECKVFKGENKLVFAQILFPLHLYRIKADVFLFLAFQSPILFRHRRIYNTIHDLTCWDCPETMKKHMEWYFKLEICNALRISKGIITISKFTRKRIIEHFQYDKDKIILAYCGISDVFMDFVREQKSLMTKDELDKRLDIRHKYHLPEQYLLCLATLEPRKNLPFLVETYVELQEEERINIPLVLAGRKGWKMDEFLERIEDRYRKNIIVTGFIDDKDLPYIYHMADCFIFPSVYEGFGMPPLEAMSVGTLVISSDASSLPEVLGRAAAYFQPGDKQELKEKLKLGIRQECGDVTVSEIKKKVEKFQWDKAAAAIAEKLLMDCTKTIGNTGERENV